MKTFELRRIAIKVYTDLGEFKVIADPEDSIDATSCCAQVLLDGHMYREEELFDMSLPYEDAAKGAIERAIRYNDELSKLAEESEEDEQDDLEGMYNFLRDI